MQRTQLAATILTLVLVGLLTGAFLGEVVDDKWGDRICEERAGPGFEYVGDTTGGDHTMWCVGPSGNAVEVSALVNSTGRLA